LEGVFSTMVSKQIPHILSFERATANDSSMSLSCCRMHS
jgi:hypothetical protein